MTSEKYIYKSCPIPGGGYVTGFVFHENEPGVLYCRTDIGGTYRYEPTTDSWTCLIHHVTMEDPSETFPIALALDPSDADTLYIVCGVGKNHNHNELPLGKIAVSHDRGDTFEYHDLPFFVHGNLNGRGTGYRLIVDRRDTQVLFFASQEDGLWRSNDQGATWIKLNSFPENHMTMVGQSLDGKIMFAAGAGVSTKVNDNLRGHSLYVSMDSGESFMELHGPEDSQIDGVAFAGHIAQRYAMDHKYLYITYAVMGRNAYVHENGYSCDGGSVIGGRIFRYPWGVKADEMRGEDVTPDEYPEDTSIVQGLLEYGFGGISTSPQNEGLLIASTISREPGDCIYRSMDYGNTWECILHGLDCGVMDFRSSYMKPQFNGGKNLIHWLSDIKIDPHNEQVAWFNTGTGVFRTDNLCDKVVHFSDRCDGIEETVHLNLYCPPDGDVVLIDILGDLGGFAFTDIDAPCENSFADDCGNRYITCINADYSDEHPECVVVTPRGNWTGKTKGGLIYSEDQCHTFRRINLPYGLSDELDKAFETIETPNVNSGWVAMAPDTNTLVWSVARGIELPVSQVIVSHDRGETFKLVHIYDSCGQKVTTGGFKVYSDRVDSMMFYGFGSGSDIYVSRDGGDTFVQVDIVIKNDDIEKLPDVDFNLIDCANKTEVRFNSGHKGSFYMALAASGLWKIQFDPDVNKAYVERLTDAGDCVYRLGLGIGSPDADYMRDTKALYMAARIGGVYGFYRTVDEGNSYTKLNTDRQMFGDINSIAADPRVYGRYFIATGSCGVLYGTPDLE